MIILIILNFYLSINVFKAINDLLFNAFFKHEFIPFLKTFLLRNFLLWRVAMEDVVIALGWWTSPYVRHCVAELLAVFQIAKQNFMVDIRSEITRLEELN